VHHDREKRCLDDERNPCGDEDIIIPPQLFASDALALQPQAEKNGRYAGQKPDGDVELGAIVVVRLAAGGVVGLLSAPESWLLIRRNHRHRSWLESDMSCDRKPMLRLQIKSEDIS